jgi:hypothetical protein
MVPRLANGELLWITDDKKLYIGDGTTASSALVPVTGFNAENAQDAAALLFTTTPTHSGISFAYDDLAGKLTATVNLTDYNGTIRASSFNGSLVGRDDSSILVNAETGIFSGDLVGNVEGNVLGNVISTNTSATVLNTAGATAIFTGTVTGNLVGNVTGNTDGYHTGDVKGSVFADNSSILVDSVDRIFYGTIDTGDTIINSNSITCSSTFSIGSTASLLDLELNLNNNLQVQHSIAGATGKFISLNLRRGTLSSPAAVQAGDELGGVVVNAFSSSSTTALAGTFGFIVDSTAVIAGGSFIKSKAFISASTDTGSASGDALVIDSAGVTTSNAFVASKYTQLAVYANDAARTSSIATPAKGMMVFMTAGTSPAVTNKAVVYDGTNWVALH